MTEKQPASKPAEPKKCFYITPAGDPGTDIRDHADGMLEAIRPVCEEFGFEIKPQHERLVPGSIKGQIVEQVVNSDLVIADLTEHNPNVFWELGLRHATGKLTIMIIKEGWTFPFDLNSDLIIRTKTGWKDIGPFQDKLREMIQNGVAAEEPHDNPVTRALNQKTALAQMSELSSDKIAKIVKDEFARRDRESKMATSETWFDVISSRERTEREAVRARSNAIRAVEARFRNADFSGKDLRGAQYLNCELDGASFKGADLRMTDFTGSSLIGAQFEDAVFDRHTEWPRRMAGVDLLGAFCESTGPDPDKWFADLSHRMGLARSLQFPRGDMKWPRSSTRSRLWRVAER